MRLIKTKKFWLFNLILIFLLTSGLSCKLFPAKTPPTALTQNVELSWWGVWDNSSDVQPLIDDFQALHPNISIKYKKFRYQEYEQQLLEAWAEDRGPDIYSIPATWIKKYQSRIAPMPNSVKLSFQEVTKTLGKTEVNTYVRELGTFSLGDIKNQFTDVVYNDVILDGRIFGLPFSLDTLVLYYNRDLLDAAGVPTPPANWTQLKETVKQVTTINQNNSLLQAGIALGAADNIPRAIDLASLLMMQNGAQMSNANGQAAFHLSPSKEKDYFPGLEALKFYTDFADPIKEVYTWNDTQPDAFEAFVSGQVAMFYGYAYYLPLIKTQAPKLDLGVTGMTQIEGSAAPVNYTDYWVQTVSHKNKSADAAWGFLTFAARQGEVDKYLNLTRRPTALRGLVEKQKADPELAVFANQILNATHWYHGRDVLKMEEYFKQMIKELPASAEPLLLMEQTAAKINQTL